PPRHRRRGRPRRKSTAFNKVGYAAIPGEARRFYDDNGLLIIQFADIYKMLGETKTLDQARIAYTFNHNDRDAFWGLPQHETQLGSGMFYSMAVNQTGLGAAMLYELTSESQYLEDARSYYGQLINPQVKLLDSYWKLFHQYTFYKNGQWSYSGTLDGQTVNGMGFRAYQTSHVVQLGLSLFRITGESHYLEKAKMLMEASISYWYRPGQGLNENSFWGGDDMIDALMDLFEETGELRYFTIASDIIDFLIDYGRDKNGYYPSDYNDNFGKWNLDRRDESPAVILMMGQAAAAAGILRVAAAYESLSSGTGEGGLSPASVNRVRAYPNPVPPGGVLRLRFEEELNGPLSIEIYGMDGRLLHREILQAAGREAFLNVPASLGAPANLLLRVISGNRTVNHTLIQIAG
ncbi:MAG: hypothetical protein R6V75_07160, partial [Bacteroidales bacterium]